MKDIHHFSGRLGNEMFRHAYLYSQVRDGVLSDVYLQDFKYFEKYADEIKELFGEGIGFLPYVGIHIRRGDYVDNKFYTDLSKTNYYTKAIKKFPSWQFLVFSDDPEFARSYFPDETNYQIMEGGDEMEDLNLMASCSHNVIANSSYSYWAAFLNPNPAKTIIAPIETKYYADGIVRTKYPKEFTQLDFKYV